MPEDLDDIIDATDTASNKPQSASVDGNNVTAHSLPDRIALEKHRAANAQAVSAGRLIFNKISPPGAA
jgi:hypothetical protein